MFGLDYDPFTGKKKKSDAEKIRSALTPAMKASIHRVVGHKCENCGRKGKLQVHHIVAVSKANGKDLNVGSNLIAICGGCHDEVRTQVAMKKIVSKRSKTKKQEITNILRNRTRLETKQKASKSGDIFGVESNPFNLSDSGGKKKGKKKKKDEEFPSLVKW